MPDFKLKAKVLDSEGIEKSLSRIAHESGFSSHSHFTALFHREFGVTPAQARGMRLAAGRLAMSRH